MLNRIEDYKSYLISAEKAITTVKQYVSIISAFLRWLGDRQVV